MTKKFDFAPKKEGNGAAPKMNLDVSKLETVRCENCGGVFFEEVTMFKEVPAIQSPTGQKSMLPIPVVRCVECGEIHPKFTPKELLA